MTESLTLTLAIPADHPAFPGHFPARPILPGAALLDLVVLALEDALTLEPGALQLVSGKFLAAVGPGATLRLYASPGRAGGWRCTLSDAAGSTVAQCEVRFGTKA
ncbi:3-hydroxylacyl-ACP dehydratase [Crenobacter cavernae]|uniref:3-hydroxylacyl-ACP dehydratase n=1 Tax=Crenobacter cavernae TaxID=2290923 RepID=A0ABY0FCK9_9NEIS|nr:3-hydroxylacyl-ACP dehydratase [Crenobacter cavernae]RXZ43867.1 3-hydroxylacyl-ACP dehydratase [Crenobacter cavernae]